MALLVKDSRQFCWMGGFFLLEKNGEASRWRVFYQRGPPRLVGHSVRLCRHTIIYQRIFRTYQLIYSNLLAVKKFIAILKSMVATLFGRLKFVFMLWLYLKVPLFAILSNICPGKNWIVKGYFHRKPTNMDFSETETKSILFTRAEIKGHSQNICWYWVNII